MMKHEWEQLRKYAYTDRQLELIDMKIRGLTNAEIQQELNVERRTVERHLQKVRLSAAKRGWSPEHDMQHTVPDGFKVKGTSTLYKDGEPVIQWVKSDIDNQRQLELMREAIEALNEEIKPEPKIDKPKVKKSELANLYVITDYHAGMLAWHEETGLIGIYQWPRTHWLSGLLKPSNKARRPILAYSLS